MQCMHSPKIDQANADIATEISRYLIEGTSTAVRAISASRWRSKSRSACTNEANFERSAEYRAGTGEAGAGDRGEREREREREREWRKREMT